MSLATIERRLDDVWAWNSSTRLPLAEEPDNWLATFGEYCDFEPAAFAAHYVTHKNMMQQSASEDEQTFHALCYVRLRSYEPRSVNSSASLGAAAAEHYDKIEHQLIELAQAEDPPVEKAAAVSALTVIDELKSRNVAPPELSWHGGDAVVMLWALADTTYAITVTEGEFGYVVRRNRKPIRRADSLPIHSEAMGELGFSAYALSDLR